MNKKPRVDKLVGADERHIATAWKHADEETRRRITEATGYTPPEEPPETKKPPGYKGR